MATVANSSEISILVVRGVVFVIPENHSSGLRIMFQSVRQPASVESQSISQSSCLPRGHWFDYVTSLIVDSYGSRHMHQ